jgi:uncharacterized protein
MSTATFHAGEREVQARVGVERRLAEIGPKVIRDFMAEQHRDFFEQLPFVIAGSVDAGGQPWASILTGHPGFIESPDALQLDIHALPLPADPLAGNLRDGAPIGLLGIEPYTRRRNRMNGVVTSLTDSGFAVQVSQSFGNCPKYIQARETVFAPRVPGPVHNGTGLDEAARRLIRSADTLFIATASPADAGDLGRAAGADVSHRGGKPGFVRVDMNTDTDAGATLTIPDFTGNFFFNTLGNIALNPKAGLLFIDFDRGDVLYVAVHAEIIWSGPEVDAFAGALRLLRCRVVSTRRLEAALPLHWGSAQLSPVLEATGDWDLWSVPGGIA